jgi:hypothetical protein
VKGAAGRTGRDQGKPRGVEEGTDGGHASLLQ